MARASRGASARRSADAGTTPAKRGGGWWASRTEEEKAAWLAQKTAQRTGAMDALHAGVSAICESGEFKRALEFWRGFRASSWTNTLMILTQRSEATAVAGYEQWRDKGRQVRTGAKAIQIWAPRGSNSRRNEQTAERSAATPSAEPDAQTPDKETDGEQSPKSSFGFVLVSVFDIADTDPMTAEAVAAQEAKRARQRASSHEPSGPRRRGGLSVNAHGSIDDPSVPTGPLPQILDGDDANASLVRRAAEAVARDTLGYGVRYDDDASLPSGANGLCAFEQHELVVRSTLPGNQQVKTLLHEMAHAASHEDLVRNALPAQLREMRQFLEVEAESVAYLTCRDFGLDTSDYSFAYVAKWGGSPAALLAVGDRAGKVATTLTTAIADQLFRMEQAYDLVGQGAEPAEAYAIPTQPQRVNALAAPTPGAASQTHATPLTPELALVNAL